jgi:hypothetical protein
MIKVLRNQRYATSELGDQSLLNFQMETWRLVKASLISSIDVAVWLWTSVLWNFAGASGQR